MSDKVDLKLDWCSYQAAKFAVEHWHYSKTIPANRSNYIGVWEDGVFIGAIIFGLGASPSLGKPYGLGIFEISELTRVALNSHKSSVSKILSIAIKMVKNKNKGIRLLVSFADQFREHTGVIYQANNWIYTGETSPSEMLLINGDYIDPRRYNGHGHNKKQKIPVGAVTVKTPPKYRYLFPLDDAMRKQIEPLRKPYPKRERGETDSAADSNPQTGGASPTRSL